jgi:hypothetical protein
VHDDQRRRDECDGGCEAQQRDGRGGERNYVIEPADGRSREAEDRSSDAGETQEDRDLPSPLQIG